CFGQGRSLAASDASWWSGEVHRGRVWGGDVDHGRRRGAYRAGRAVEPFDLGDEPPLSVDGQSGGPIDRRRISVQWFSGTILTGLFDAALLGSDVFPEVEWAADCGAVA